MSDSTSPARVLAILEMFEREKRPLSLKELSDYCSIPTSTCHALVQILLRRSYLYLTGQRKDLYPTRRVYDMGATLLAHDAVLQRLMPVMEGLREATQETVILGKRQRDHVLYLEVLEGPQTIRYSARAGETKPLHSTCIGKTVLSTMKPEDIRRWLDERPARQITDNTITSPARLMQDLEQGKKTGYFMTRGENVPDVSALSAPIHLNNDLFGLAVAGPSYRVDARVREIAQALLQAARSLGEPGAAGS
jgi:DNA-binding IclR family transcriptional regulator